VFQFIIISFWAYVSSFVPGLNRGLFCAIDETVKRIHSVEFIPPIFGIEFTFCRQLCEKEPTPFLYKGDGNHPNS